MFLIIQPKHSKPNQILGQRIILFADAKFNSELDDYLVIDVRKNFNNTCLKVNTFESNLELDFTWDHYAHQKYVDTYYYCNNWRCPYPSELINTASWFRWNIEGLNGQVSSVWVENVAKDAGSIELFASDTAGTEFLCKFEYLKDEDFDREDLRERFYCENDEARSMRICNARQGDVITVFDDPYFAKDDDFLTIHVLTDMLDNCVSISNFENNRRIHPSQFVETEYHEPGWFSRGLNGDVSAISIELGKI